MWRCEPVVNQWKSGVSGCRIDWKGCVELPLSYEDAQAIRNELQLGKSGAQLARERGVTRATISLIKQRKIHAHAVRQARSTLTFRLSKDEKKALTAAAHKAGETASAFIRKAIVERMQQYS